MRAALALAVLFRAALLPAQSDRVHFDIALSASPSQEGPTITASNLLADANTRDLLVRGNFPAGIHFRLELWRKGTVLSGDDLEGRSEWDVVVSYDPTQQLFNVLRRQDDKILENFGGFPSISAAEAQFDGPYRSPLHPHRGGRYYYRLVVEVQTLTETDLGALQQWLRGPSAPGNSNPLTALRSGIGKLLSRILGGDKRHYEPRSEEFTV